MLFVLFIYLKALAKYFNCLCNSKTVQIVVIKNSFQPNSLYILHWPDFKIKWTNPLSILMFEKAFQQSSSAAPGQECT